jgi:hypothetical protein
MLKYPHKSAVHKIKRAKQSNNASHQKKRNLRKQAAYLSTNSKASIQDAENNKGGISQDVLR